MHACSKHQVVHRYGGPLLELLQALEGCGFTLGHAGQAQGGGARGWRDQLGAVQAESKGAGTAAMPRPPPPFGNLRRFQGLEHTTLQQHACNCNVPPLCRALCNVDELWVRVRLVS